MDLIKITDLTNQLHISSRSLRYYEKVGLIHSVRPAFEAYRYYDAETVERLRQILVLRKMQVPIKDIIRIYENAQMSTVVEVFTDRIHAMDDEIHSLTELRHIVSEFLQTMMENGIKKISALPLLYEEMDKQLKAMEEGHPVGFERLSAVSDTLNKPPEPAIVCLPAMRVLSSYQKEQPTVSDPNGFCRFMQQHGPMVYRPGSRQWFEFETDGGDGFIAAIPDDFINNSIYRDFAFEGGLFATVHVFLDDDLGEQLRRLMAAFDRNPFYEVAYNRHGGLRHPVLLEKLIAPDEKRDLVALFVPVKKRLPNPALFDPPKETDGITVRELESAHRVLWAKEAALDGLTPVKKAGGVVLYEVLPTGEARFATYVGTRYLSTNIEVKLPFRVDVTFKYDEAPPNADEAFRIYFGDFVLAVNDENHPDPALSKHAIRFTQPIFGDWFTFPLRGRVKKGEYNTVTWIAGETYFTVLINGEVRLCLENLPYMQTDFSMQPQSPILINGGGAMTIQVRTLTVSQLEATIKKRKNGDLIMQTKQSNNQIEGIPAYCVGERGENFHFDGVCERVMAVLGETEYDYWLIAGLTGDAYTQVYPKNGVFYPHRYCVSDYHILYDTDCSAYIEGIFGTLGYACTYVSGEELLANPEMYRQTLMAYIDKGVPVIQFKGDYHLIVGYEDNGKTLLCQPHEGQAVVRERLDNADGSDEKLRGWIFVGEKKEQKDPAQLYRDAVNKMAETLTTETADYRFGAGAFDAWAQDVEQGFYEDKTPDTVDLWKTHTGFVACFETVTAKCWMFLTKALALNPDLTFIEAIIPIFGRQGAYAIGGLDDLGGGFNVTLAALQDRQQRTAIAERIRLFARNMDEIVRILREAQPV